MGHDIIEHMTVDPLAGKKASWFCRLLCKQKLTHSVEVMAECLTTQTLFKGRGSLEQYFRHVINSARRDFANSLHLEAKMQNEPQSKVMDSKKVINSKGQDFGKRCD